MKNSLDEIHINNIAMTIQLMEINKIYVIYKVNILHAMYNVPISIYIIYIKQHYCYAMLYNYL